MCEIRTNIAGNYVMGCHGTGYYLRGHVAGYHFTGYSGYYVTGCYVTTVNYK